MNNTTPRQYRLLRDLPDAKAGTILTFDENNCYDYESKRLIKSDDTTVSWYNKEFVENSPDWFELVTPVVENEKKYLLSVDDICSIYDVWSLERKQSFRSALNEYVKQIPTKSTPPTTSSIEEEKNIAHIKVNNFVQVEVVCLQERGTPKLVNVKGQIKQITWFDKKVYVLYFIPETKETKSGWFCFDDVKEWADDTILQPKQPTQQEVDREHYEIKEWDKGSLTIRRISDGQIFKPLDNVYWTYSDNKDKNFREDGVILEIVISKSENTNLQFHIKKENGEIVTKYLSNLNKVNLSQPTFTMDEIKSCCHDDSAGGGCLYLSMDKLLKLGKTK